MGGAYLALGLATMLAPNLMIAIALTDPAQANAVTRLIFQCFGLQASLCGLVILLARFGRLTYAVFGAAMLPILVFDYWFSAIDPVLTFNGAAIDAVFNLIFIALCAVGFLRGAPVPSRQS